MPPDIIGFTGEIEDTLRRAHRYDQLKALATMDLVRVCGLRKVFEDNRWLDER